MVFGQHNKLQPLIGSVTDRWTVYVDGCAKGNPGASGIGATFLDEQGQEGYVISADVGLGTNNMAEYKAVARAMWDAHSLGIRRLCILSDSTLVVNQINGKFACRNQELQSVLSWIKEAQGYFDEFTIEYVPREKNHRADRLANEGLYR